MTEADFVVRPPKAAEKEEWASLFRGYRAFYNLEPDEAVVERVWSWIHDPHHDSRALVAVDGGDKLVGLAHFRAFARPSTGSIGTWLDDLFTTPDTRGRGVGRLLLDSVTHLSREDGRSAVRWITAADNATAQGLYDAVAKRTTWLMYEAMLT